MVKSTAATVEEYIAALPPERRAVVEGVREVVRQNLPAGYEEAMRWGMISYEVPLARYPQTYNGQPLSYVALAAQKNCYAIYLTSAHHDAEQLRLLREGFAGAGLKLDMGKSCLRFRQLADLPLDVIGRAVASTGPDQFIATYEAARRR